MIKKREFASYIQQVRDFPKPGVTYLDLNPLYMNPHWLKLVDVFKINNGAKVMAIESRGFILGGALCQRHKMGFIPVRKKGKLPGPILSQSYALEYGTDTVEIQKVHGRHSVYIVDDVVATGGTITAAYHLAKAAGYSVVGAISLVNISNLNASIPKQLNLHSIFEAKLTDYGFYEIS